MSSDVVFKKRQCETNTEEKCSSEDLWKKIDERYLAFAEFRDVSLDRFHRQAMLQSGAVQRSSLKILQQGISAQVVQNLWGYSFRLPPCPVLIPLYCFLYC